jgi:hypothetical protein
VVSGITSLSWKRRDVGNPASDRRKQQSFAQPGDRSHEGGLWGTLHGRHSELWHFADVDLAAMAGTMGVQGITVRQASEFRSAMEKGLASTGPALINVVTDIEALAPPGNAERANSHA